MKISDIPEPNPTFKSYMKRFRKDTIYRISAFVLVHFLNYAIITLTHVRSAFRRLESIRLI